jgi:hypothetical protein
MLTRVGAYIGLGSVLIALVEGGRSEMYDTLLNVVHKANVVAFARVEKTGRVNVAGTEFLRVEAKPTEVLKGGPARNSYVIDIHFAGKETPALEENEEYLFILRPFDSDSPGRLRTVEMTQPRRVSSTVRAKFAENLRKYVGLASRTPTDGEIKQLIMEMLRSNIAFFESDAAMTADGVSHWTTRELEELAALIEERKEELPAEARENLIAVIARAAEPGFLEDFMAKQIVAGATEAIYYGLVNRPAPDHVAVVRKLFESGNASVRLGAVRLAGLLRDGAMLDSFERQIGAAPQPTMRQAIAEARKLAKRVL